MHIEEKAATWLKETQKGYIRIAVLILLNKKPHHGYEIMKAVEELLLTKPLRIFI